MTRREIKRELKNLIPKMEETEDYRGEENYRCIYLGSYLSLDPCGKYHHLLSPNGVTKRCKKFWDNLNECAEELGGWIQNGEGDGLDTFFCMPLNS